MDTARTPDWRSAEAYAFTALLTREQWAWEFLRRNADYRADWQWFSDTWRTLEARYGAPPDRDFFRWKQDTRAYRDDDEGNPLLIECWMGARWGLYKFPLNPALTALQVSPDLHWRRPRAEVVLVRLDTPEYLDELDGKVALGFDLTLPLKEQMETAKRWLVGEQRRRCGTKPLPLRTVAGSRAEWTLCLRALDAQDNASTPEIVALLCDDEEGKCQDLLQRARQLAAGGYFDVLRFPD